MQHSGGKIDFDNLQGERSYSGFGPYGNSKLENILFTMELARRLEGTGVTVNALHPGLTRRDSGKNNPGFLMKIMGAVIPLIARSPEKGAKTSIYLASSPEVQSITGKYFIDCKEPNQLRRLTIRLSRGELWDISAEMVHLADAVPAMA